MVIVKSDFTTTTYMFNADTTNDDNTITKTSSHGEIDLQRIFLLQQFCQNSFFSGQNHFPSNH